METATVADLAWMAGVFDSDSSIFIMKQHRKDRDRSHNYILRISVEGADDIKANEIMRITKLGSTNVGKVHVQGRSNTLKWQVDGRKAMSILKAVLPFMRVKLKQAEAAIAFQETTKKHWRKMEPHDYAEQERYYQLLKDLKCYRKLGNKVPQYQAASKLYNIETYQ